MRATNAPDRATVRYSKRLILATNEVGIGVDDVISSCGGDWYSVDPRQLHSMVDSGASNSLVDCTDMGSA